MNTQVTCSEMNKSQIYFHFFLPTCPGLSRYVLSRIMEPQRHPSPNAWNLWIYHLTRQRDFVYDYGKDLEIKKDILSDPGVPNLISQDLRNVKGRRKERESESSYVRKRCWLLRRRIATRQGVQCPLGEDGPHFISGKKIGLGSRNCKILNSANNPNEGGHAVCVCSCGESCPTLCNPLDCSPPGSSFMGFTNKKYWSGLPFPSPGDLSTQGWNSHLLCLLDWRQILYPLSHRQSPTRTQILP